MTDIILKGAQILNAHDYDLIRDNLNPSHRLIFDGLIFTGMRVEEFWRFIDHPQWFHADRQYVELPRGSILKVRARQKERMVLLSNVGTRAVKDLVHAVKRGEIRKITRQGWREDLQRAARKGGLSTQGITPKMCRKTWVSWLMTVYPDDGLRIAASTGHDTTTLIHHYLNLPFSNSEREQIRMYVVGWGGRN